MAYTKTQWVNNGEPPINATNLNNIENGIEELDLNKADVTLLEGHLVNVGNEVDSDYKVNILYSNLLHNASWEQGTISGSTGALSDSTTRIRTQFIKVQPNTKYTIKMNSSYGYGVMGYSSNNVSTFTENMIVAFQTGTNTFTTGNSTNYIRVVVATGSPNYQTTITTSAVSLMEAIISLGESIITPTINVDGEDIYNKQVLDTTSRFAFMNKDIGDNLNNAKQCGIYPYTQGTANRPNVSGIGEYGMVVVFDVLNGNEYHWIYQFAIANYGTKTTATRVSVDGGANWSSWT